MLWERYINQALPQALEIIFELQRKRSNEKTNQQKKTKHFNL